MATNDPHIKIIVDERTDEFGRRFKVTRKILTKLVKEKVFKDVAVRKTWQKFGDAQGNAPGPDISSTIVGEQVFLKLAVGKDFDLEEEIKIVDKNKQKTIQCRLCKGDHFTSKCPFKDSLQAVENLESAINASKAALGAETSGGVDESNKPSKFIPSRLRDRDDSCTLRLTNLVEETTERDLHQLCGSFGPISRIYVAKNKDTGLARGFAFVTFGSKFDAEKALKKLNGHIYGSLILKVEWSKPS